MKKSIYLHLAAIFLMASAMSGCQDMESLSHSGNIHVVKASIENRTTRVGLSQGDASLDMIAQWQSDDQINILINGGSNTYDVGLVPIQDLSANGKSCTFQYTVPKDLNGASDGYQLNCFTSNCSPKEQGGDIYCDASLVRAPISQFKARVMATQHVDDPDCTAAFRHYGTYEVLHFTNNTDHDITFSLCGFEADNLWYTEGSCALRLSDNSYVADPSYEAVEESPVVTIPAQGTETIVSWYVPNGKKRENAATWTSYAVPWLLCSLRSLIPFALVVSQSRYRPNHLRRPAKSPSERSPLSCRRMMASSRKSASSYVSMMPMPRPLQMPGMDCPYSRFGFMAVSGSRKNRFSHRTPASPARRPSPSSASARR